MTQTVPDISPLMPMHQDPLLVVPVRATRCRYRPRAWVWVRLAWPGSAAQGKPRRPQAGQAVALRRPGKTRKVSPGFEKYCMNQHKPNCSNDYLTLIIGEVSGFCRNIIFRILAIIFVRFGFFEVFQAFFLHVLRYQFETWYIHAVGGVTRQVRV